MWKPTQPTLLSFILVFGPTKSMWLTDLSNCGVHKKEAGQKGRVEQDHPGIHMHKGFWNWFWGTQGAKRGQNVSHLWAPVTKWTAVFWINDIVRVKSGCPNIKSTAIPRTSCHKGIDHLFIPVFFQQHNSRSSLCKLQGFNVWFFVCIWLFGCLLTFAF